MTEDITRKEFLGVVTIQGKEYKLYMPTMGELEPIIDELVKPTEKAYSILYRLGAIALNMALEDFRGLPLHEGMAVINKLGGALQVLGNLTKGKSH